MTADRWRTCGFSYFEVLLAAVLLAAGVTCAGMALEQSASVTGNAPVAATADYLLQDGVAWVRSLPRLDASGAATIGMESGETTLAHVDDVDDLDGVVETDPVDRTGAVFTGWVRSWRVVSADLANPAIAATPGSTPLLGVSIGVTSRGVVIASDTILLSRTP